MARQRLNWRTHHTALVPGLTAAALIVADRVRPTPSGWYLVIFLLLAVVVAAGHGVTGFYRGTGGPT